MLKKTLFALIVACMTSGFAMAQTDSTDLDLYMTSGVLETPLDSMLFSGEEFEQLNLDVTISDTLLFSKVHIKLVHGITNIPLFIGIFSHAELVAIEAVDNWNIIFPFGLLSNLESYKVEVIVENFDGSLGETLIKTYTP